MLFINNDEFIIAYSQPEVQILDYVTQQHKLFVPMVTSHALRVVGMWLWSTYLSVSRDLNHGNLDQLPEVHFLLAFVMFVYHFLRN